MKHSKGPRILPPAHCPLLLPPAPCPLPLPPAPAPCPCLLLLLLLLPLLLTSPLSAQGIQFEQSTLAETLAKAQKEGKTVFVDAMTSWCGPCKKMATEVFTDDVVGDFFNAYFVNIKLDMEKGEGIDVSNRYKIWVYPTLLFLDSTGKVLHRSAGYYAPEALIALARTALDPFHNLAALEAKYASGNRSREFLLKYLDAKTLAYDPDAGRIANDFLQTEENLRTSENMDLLMHHVNDPYSKGFRFLLKNRTLFEDEYGKREVKAKIETVFESYLQCHPGLQLGEVQRLYGTVYPEGGEELASRYRLDYYRQKGDTDNFAQTAIDHYNRYPSTDPDELNEMAAIFAEEIAKPAQLKIALSWVQKAISLQELSYYQYTLAKVWAKMGKKKSAQKAAERSIELAKIEGEDPLLAEELLAGLKK